MDAPPPGRPTPYRAAAWQYKRAGWDGVLPLPFRCKKSPPTGWTGHHDAWPSAGDIQAWVDSDRSDEGRGNIALRMAYGGIGIDVDGYGDKGGAKTLAEAEAKWGPLPATWWSTSRDDGVSGIRMFRCPEGLAWPGAVGPGIETVHARHRYAVVYPSVHPEGRVYRWIRPDGIVSTEPPRFDELPELPEAWVAGLTGGLFAEEVRLADLSNTQAWGWVGAHSRPGICRAMGVVRDRLLAELTTGSAHESLRRLLGLVRLAEKGHGGLTEVVTQVLVAFLAEATSSARGGSTRSQAEARSEFDRSLTGAVRRVVGSPEAPPDAFPADPCDQPYGLGILTPEEIRAPRLQTSGTAALMPVPGPPASRESASVTENTSAVGSTTTSTGPALSVVPSGEVTEEAKAAERTSWWPRNMAEALSGENRQPPPCLLHRTDGKALFYAGKVNGLMGESESGKTWVALLAVVQMLLDGQNVLYLDFEDSIDGITGRLRALGATDDMLVAHLTYIDPDESLHLSALADFTEVLDERDYRGVVVDGVNAAMTLFGLKIDSNDDANTFSQKLLKPLARRGCAVITIDHVSKNKETRGKGQIGAQQKRAMITGCQLLVEMTSPLGHGLVGKMALRVDKDRAGHVRGMSEKGEFAGTATMQSSFDGAEVSIQIEPVGARTTARQAEEKPPFRPTVLMAAASKMLSTCDGSLSQKQIEEGVSGRAVIIRMALSRLVEEGFASREAGPRNALLYRHIKLFRDLDDLVSADDEEA